MNLKPDQRVRLQKNDELTVFDAVVINVYNDSFSVRVYGAAGDVFNPGDELVVEYTQWEDGLYIIQARVTDVLMDRDVSCCLTIRMIGSGRVQRRRAERMVVHIPAELLSLKESILDQYKPKGLILNISHSGALISVSNPLEVGEELLLMFDVSVDKEKVSIGTTGQVVREHLEYKSQGVSYCYGVHFKKPERMLVS